MTAERHSRGRPAPLRWGWPVVVVGLLIAGFGIWLELRDAPPATEAAVATPSPDQTAVVPTARPSVKPSVKPSGKPVATPGRTPPTTKPTKPTKPGAAPGRPQRISLPGLGVSAPVVGIRARGGALTPPGNPRTVGWWSDGAQPGASRGSAVITGHTVHSGGGAFDDLDRLGAGDTAQVRTSRGLLTYRVESVRTYRKASLAAHAAQVFDQSTPGRLVLVTCEDWNGSIYLSNVVVVARRV